MQWCLGVFYRVQGLETGSLWGFFSVVCAGFGVWFDLLKPALESVDPPPTHTQTHPSKTELRLLLKTGHTGHTSGLGVEGRQGAVASTSCCSWMGQVGASPSQLCSGHSVMVAMQQAPALCPLTSHLGRQGARTTGHPEWACVCMCLLLLLPARLTRRLYLLASLGRGQHAVPMGPVWPNTCVPK